MDEPVVAECASEQKKSEHLENELKAMNDFKETLGYEQMPSFDGETGCVSEYFNFVREHTSQQFSSISSDDGTETYHSLEGEPLITDHHQNEEPYEGGPLEVSASATAAEMLVEPDNHRDEERDPNKTDGEATTTASNEYLVESGNDDGNERVTDEEQKIILMNEQAVIRSLPRAPQKTDSEATTTADEENLADSGNDDGNERVTGEEHEGILMEEQAVMSSLPRSLADLSWPLETVEEEIITSFADDDSDDDNVGQFPKNTALTDNRPFVYETPQFCPRLCSEESTSDMKTINERPDGFEPLVSSASTTPDSMNTVEAVMTAEALKNYVTINVDVEDEPGLPTSRSEFNEGLKSPEKLDGGPRTYSDGEVKVKMMDEHELLTSEPYDGLKSSAKFEGGVGTFCNGEVTLNAFHMETDEHGKTVYVPGLATPWLAQDEAFLTSIEMTLSHIKHFGLQPRLAPSDQVVEPSFDASNILPGSSMKFADGNGTYKKYATKEEMLQDCKIGTEYEGNDPENRNNGISSGSEGTFIESIRKAMDERERLKRDGISNPCFQDDNAHSITTCEANACQGISDGTSDEYDLENARTFHDLVNQLRDKSGNSNPDLEEVTVISLSEMERENVQDLKISEVLFGPDDEEPYRIEFDDTGKAYEQPRRSNCAICCLKVKKCVLTPSVIFVLFTIMFVVFCIIMRFVFDSTAHAGHRQHHGNTPAPTI